MDSVVNIFQTREEGEISDLDLEDVSDSSLSNFTKNQDDKSEPKISLSSVSESEINQNLNSYKTKKKFYKHRLKRFHDEYSESDNSSCDSDSNINFFNNKLLLKKLNKAVRLNNSSSKNTRTNLSDRLKYLIRQENNYDEKLIDSDEEEELLLLREIALRSVLECPKRNSENYTEDIESKNSLIDICDMSHNNLGNILNSNYNNFDQNSEKQINLTNENINLKQNIEINDPQDLMNENNFANSFSEAEVQTNHLNIDESNKGKLNENLKEEDSDLNVEELRIEALKSAFVKKYSLKKQLKITKNNEQIDSKEYQTDKDSDIPNRIIYIEDSDKAEQSTNEFDSNDSDSKIKNNYDDQRHQNEFYSKNKPKNVNFEEDEDLLRAMLLSSMGNKISKNEDKSNNDNSSPRTSSPVQRLVIQLNETESDSSEEEQQINLFQVKLHELLSNARAQAEKDQKLAESNRFVDDKYNENQKNTSKEIEATPLSHAEISNSNNKTINNSNVNTPLENVPKLSKNVILPPNNSKLKPNDLNQRKSSAPSNKLEYLRLQKQLALLDENNRQRKLAIMLKNQENVKKTNYYSKNAIKKNNNLVKISKYKTYNKQLNRIDTQFLQKLDLSKNVLMVNKSILNKQNKKLTMFNQIITNNTGKPDEKLLQKQQSSLNQTTKNRVTETKVQETVTSLINPQKRILEGKYKNLTSIVQKTKLAKIERDKAGENIRRLIEELKNAKQTYVKCHQYYKDCVQEYLNLKANLSSDKSTSFNPGTNQTSEQKKIVNNLQEIEKNNSSKEIEKLDMNSFKNSANHGEKEKKRKSIDSDPMIEICPFDLQGICRDIECEFRHFENS